MNFRIAVYRDSDRSGLKPDEERWLARELTYEFIAQSHTREKAIENTLLALAAELEFSRGDDRAPFQDLPKTPLKFVEWWDQLPREPLPISETLRSEIAIPFEWVITAEYGILPP